MGKKPGSLTSYLSKFSTGFSMQFFFYDWPEIFNISPGFEAYMSFLILSNFSLITTFSIFVERMSSSCLLRIPLSFKKSVSVYILIFWGIKRYFEFSNSFSSVELQF